MTRGIYAKVALPHHRMSAGFSSWGLRAGGEIDLDPFLNLDDFVMSVPTFPPHPHAGFSAVTYMFEDSPGAFVNRDSLGDRSRIAPGALHWTQAARGMMHEEIPERPGTACHGLQMFVNLSGEHKAAPPAAFHATPDQIPEHRAAGVRVRVLAGTIEGVASPLTSLLTPIAFYDVHLDPGATLELPAQRTMTAFGMVIRGDGAVGRDAGTAVVAHDAVGFAGDGDHLHLRGGSAGLQLLVGIGRPLREPVVFGGPFAMTTRAELADAEARFRRGEMGRLAPSF